MNSTQAVEFGCKPQNTRPRLQRCALHKGLPSELVCHAAKRSHALALFRRTVAVSRTSSRLRFSHQRMRPARIDILPLPNSYLVLSD